MDKLPPKSRDGFTLIELLVSCAVFLILTTVLIQIFGSVSNSSNSSQRRSEMLKQAVGALERVNYDLKGFVQAGGLNVFVSKKADAGGNDALIFVAPVASASSPADARQLSIVRYGIEAKPSGTPDFGGWPAMPAFSRTVRPFAWSDDLGKLVPLSSSTVGAALQSGETQQISPGVIRYEICFQLWDGTVAANPPADWKQVRALICGVVVIDRKAANTLTEAQRENLAAQFPKAGPSQRPHEAWNASLAGLPLAVRQTIRIYEQTISI